MSGLGHLRAEENTVYSEMSVRALPFKAEHLKFVFSHPGWSSVAKVNTLPGFSCQTMENEGNRSSMNALICKHCFKL